MNASDAQLEAQIMTFPTNQCLLARNIRFSAAPQLFETACREALSNPDSPTFFWREAIIAGWRHTGSAMLAFNSQPECRTAMEELQGLRFQGLGITLASKAEQPPTQLPAPPANVATGSGSAATSFAIGSWSVCSSYDGEFDRVDLDSPWVERNDSEYRYSESD